VRGAFKRSAPHLSIPSPASFLPPPDAAHDATDSQAHQGTVVADDKRRGHADPADPE